MNAALFYEWRRLRGRRDIWLVVAAVTLFIVFREAIALRDIASIANDPGLPPEAAVAERQRLDAYSLSASVGTVVVNSLIPLLIVAGLLTCLTLGGEFTSGTVRTALVVDPRRMVYMLGRLVGATVVALVVLLAIAAVGFAMPILAGVVGAPVTPTTITAQSGVFLGAAVLIVAVAVAFAGLVTSVVRSPLLSAGAFVGIAALVQLLDQPALPHDIAGLTPTRAIMRLIEATAPTGSILPGGGNFAVADTSAAFGPALVLVVWCIGLTLGTLVAFGARDIRE